ncbi:type VI secretion system tube protein Hcp [Salipiger sp. 1_MG-2023]|uniref:Hcp family type VI secretion system effector n=1 Tax=Salipiger sp. 1_MG-2023 TaxID=3062665 RepID=UPI0026E25253|nr:type VI secretion system tube protein Hcp [Salipiger sp. 1_MG-2023]MDO6584916.1 type VI secretion system tube protein Hcp [Salipiger sp. 1_MG-2023]
MAFTGYLKIPDIDGESQRAEHEDEIDITDIMWSIEQAATAQTGRGRARARADVSSLTCRKVYDASSPYIALAAMQAKSFKDVIVTVRRDSGEAHLDYLTITMTNTIISHYEIDGVGRITDSERVEREGQELQERIGFAFENIKVKYVVQEEDHSAGDEHEIEFDIAAGV